MFSEYLRSRMALCKRLVDRLSPEFEYVSVLGKQIQGKTVRVSSTTISVEESFENQSGFVVKLFQGKVYSEYSFTDITEEGLEELAQKIRDSVKYSDSFLENHVDIQRMKDEPLIQDFERAAKGKTYTVPEMIEKLTKLKEKTTAVSDKIVWVMMAYDFYDVSAIFVSKNKALTQNYSWNAIRGVASARKDKIVQEAMTVAANNDLDIVLEEMQTKAVEVGKLAVELLDSEHIQPGVYDIITAPSITGLIAHEAFGHGVEMDMFVKHRARARRYLGKPVASPLVNMHDGASATENCVGYFFDDDGVLAHDTLIIRDGILQTGISDAVSAMQLGTEPTGNGRRQDPSRKSYTRMTNTFFAPGKDKLEDMIASVEHGYMLFETSNGMEDPKTWNIQCVAQYGREIRNGKFTGKIVAPVVMSGYVPDLLQSISMVSDDFEVIGSGHCGKGYKEWVPVSDGGPCLKARCKLG